MQSADTDGDGSLNSVEVEAIGSAGFHARAEALCDMHSCAQSPGTYQLCSSNVRCRANFFSSPAANYTFNFACRPGTEGTASGTGTWGCVDVNECGNNPCGEGVCSQFSLNVWASPGYSCSCQPGYAFEGGTCVLVDECAATSCAPGCATDAGDCVDAGGDGGEGDAGAFDDAGTAVDDAGAGSDDAGESLDGAGVAEDDAGAPLHDAGAADIDSGPAQQDGGAIDASADPPADAGPSPSAQDAGASPRDAGSPSDGPLSDGGVGDDVGGCTCGVAGAEGTADVMAASLLGLLLAGLARRRKRRR